MPMKYITEELKLKFLNPPKFYNSRHSLQSVVFNVKIHCSESENLNY